MTFKIGDEVIMTADSRKGDIFEIYNNGQLKGKIIRLDADEDIFGGKIVIKVNDGEYWYFNPDGSCSTHPGMSIRPAEEKKVSCECGGNGGYLHCDKCGAKEKKKNPIEGCGQPRNIGNADIPEWAKKFDGKTVKLNVEKFIPKIDISDCLEPIVPTPSQWIEGQIPDGETGLFLVWDKASGGHPDAFYVENKQGAWHKDYIYYIKLDILPPPPPVKEVEAYGILERIKQIRSDALAGKITHNDALVKIDEAIAFYSQPATAEVLEKYFYMKNASINFGSHPMTLDKFINWYNGNTLLFTPAALDELGRNSLLTKYTVIVYNR